MAQDGQATLPKLEPPPAVEMSEDARAALQAQREGRKRARDEEADAKEESRQKRGRGRGGKGRGRGKGQGGKGQDAKADAEGKDAQASEPQTVKTTPKQVQQEVQGDQVCRLANPRQSRQPPSRGPRSQSLT